MYIVNNTHTTKNTMIRRNRNYFIRLVPIVILLLKLTKSKELGTIFNYITWIVREMYLEIWYMYGIGQT